MARSSKSSKAKKDTQPPDAAVAVQEEPIPEKEEQAAEVHEPVLVVEEDANAQPELEMCATCNGSGERADNPELPCEACQGAGAVSAAEACGIAQPAESDDIERIPVRREVKVPLSDSEYRALAEEMERLIRNGEEIESEASITSKDYKRQLTANDELLRATARRVRDPFELKNIPCTLVKNWTTGRAHVVRDDTGEMIEGTERALDPDERQMKMPFLAEVVPLQKPDDNAGNASEPTLESEGGDGREFDPADPDLSSDIEEATAGADDEEEIEDRDEFIDE